MTICVSLQHRNSCMHDTELKVRLREGSHLRDNVTDHGAVVAQRGRAQLRLFEELGVAHVHRSASSTSTDEWRCVGAPYAFGSAKPMLF